MYDTIKFVIKESELDNAICFLEEIPCRISIKSTSSNRVVGFLKNMKIEVRNTTLIVQVVCLNISRVIIMQSVCLYGMSENR